MLLNSSKRNIQIYVLVLIATSLAAIPSLGDPFYNYIASLFMILSMFALSYNILFGYAGLLSFGHAFFYAAGAYTLAIFTRDVYKDPLMGAVAAIGVALILSILIGLLTLRHSRIYFALLTLAFGMLLYALFLKWRDFTGGSDGIAGIVRSGIIIDISNPITRYYFIYFSFLLITFLLYRLHRSQLGLLIRSLGANEDFIPFTGHSVFKLRMTAFIISGSVAGFAGAMYALLLGAVTPDLAYWTTSAEPLLATLIGGPQFFLGPILGSLVFIFLTTYAARWADIWQLILGSILIVLILGSRGGVLDVVVRLWKARRY